MFMRFSGRGSSVGPKKIKSEEEESDLTRDMDDPTPEPNIQEVPIPKPPGIISMYFLVTDKSSHPNFYPECEIDLNS